MNALLDVNVLLALGWPNHEHHASVIRWLSEHRAEGWATCPLSESAFVRLSLNPRVVQHTLTAVQVIVYLRRLVAADDHRFLADDVCLREVDWIDWNLIRGYRQITDLHLVALAARHDARLVTLDGGVVELLPPAIRRHVVVVGKR